MLYPFDRLAAVLYARRWALSRNPRWYNFDDLGGDCTNFISQCLYAGRCVMNFTPNTGWYYRSLSDRAPAWTGVDAFGRFLDGHEGAGPVATRCELQDIQLGDVIQLCSNGACYHSLLVTTLLSPAPTPDTILICAHTRDSLDRPLSSYTYDSLRAYHIEGVTLW